MADEGFAVDDKIRQIAEAYALDAVDFGRNNFGIDLDWSDASVVHIEAMLTRLHDDMSSAGPSEDQIFSVAKMIGSYVGEVFRRNHGARWGMVTFGGEEFPGMQADRTGALFWPWGRVQNRLINGPEDNVAHYYSSLVERDG